MSANHAARKPAADNVIHLPPAKTKPRPDNMFRYPQDTALAPMRDKLLFIEAIAADPDLTDRERRASILLTACYSTTYGVASPAWSTSPTLSPSISATPPRSSTPSSLKDGSCGPAVGPAEVASPPTSQIRKRCHQQHLLRAWPRPIGAPGGKGVGEGVIPTGKGVVAQKKGVTHNTRYGTLRFAQSYTEIFLPGETITFRKSPFISENLNTAPFLTHAPRAHARAREQRSERCG